MPIKPIKKREQKKAAKIFWVLFPFLGFWLLWKIFKLLLGLNRFYQVKAKGKPKMLGLVAFSTFLFFNRKWFYLKYLAVDEKLQGQGIGKQALAEVEAKARGQKSDYFFLMSPPWRPGAQRFYLKQGFKRLLRFIFWKRLK